MVLTHASVQAGSVLGVDRVRLLDALAGIATSVGVIISLHQIHRDKRLRLKEEKRSQSTRLSFWYEEKRDRADQPTGGRYIWKAVGLRNMSDAPVYNVIVTCVGISGAGPNAKGEDNGHDYPCRACVGILPPGTWYAWLPTSGSGMHVRTAPEAAFTDANGRSWVRRGNGKLEEIETEPVSFYGLGLPVSWGECKRLD